MTVHLRRMYVDCRFGQLHLHTAFPSSGGFDELTPLVCVPSTPGSGRAFRPLLADLGRDRSVYALDLPGCGESDAPDKTAGITDYAAAMVDLLDTLRLRQVDVLGYHAGSFAAIEFALARPQQVRKLVLVGIPVLDARQRESAQARPLPTGPGREIAQAATVYPAGERLPLVHQPVLVLRPRDELWDATARSDALLREAQRVDLPEGESALGLQGSANVVLYARDFLDR
ncbi:MAG TPA: alpha/beta fold hydrolase [Steroidobacteraceae bacterium]|nr:alpha/beta fold hydrolase [Steroidobacteraceae bacterium]